MSGEEEYTNPRMEDWEAIEKFPIHNDDIICLEKAANLIVVSGFENSFIFDLKSRFATFGMKMVVTEKQRGILHWLAARFDATHLKSTKSLKERKKENEQ